MKMLKWWRWFRTPLSWSRQRGWKNLPYISGASLPVSEEHGCKGSEFASWVKQACLVSLNFAWHALNYINYTPICTLVKRLLLYTGHWSQLWKHICINSGVQLLIKTFMVAIFAILIMDMIWSQFWSRSCLWSKLHFLATIYFSSDRGQKSHFPAPYCIFTICI